MPRPLMLDPTPSRADGAPPPLQNPPAADLPTASAATAVTELLARWRAGDEAVLDRVLPQVYGELRRLAQHRLGNERPFHTLQATEVVHEAYLRLRHMTHPNLRSRSHFLAVAALLMRRVLVDHARRKRAARRGGELARTELDPALAGPTPDTDWLLVDQVLVGLAAIDPRKAQIVTLKFFGGLTIDELATVLTLSPITIVREWRLARAWMLRRLEPRSSAAFAGGRALGD